jgi:hypothetical protein
VATAIATVKDWFHGSATDEVALPRRSALRIGGFLFPLEWLALSLAVLFVGNVSHASGHEFLSIVAYGMWWVLVAAVIIAMIAPAIRGISRPVWRMGVDTHFVPKWYLRSVAVMTVAYTIILVISLLF